MDSLSPLDVDDIEQMSAVIPSNNKSSSESNAAPVPPTSTSPNPSHTACPEPHAVVADLPPATTMSPKAPAKRTFAAIAKKVIIQERFRKAEEEDAADEDDGRYFLCSELCDDNKIRLITSCAQTTTVIFSFSYIQIATYAYKHQVRRLLILSLAQLKL